MKISKIIREITDVAKKYNLQFVETDRTDNIISLKLLIDNDLFIQVYGNTLKEKLNLALVFKNRSMAMTLKVVNTIVIPLIALMNIFLLMKRNPYTNL